MANPSRRRRDDKRRSDAITAEGSALLPEALRLRQGSAMPHPALGEAFRADVLRLRPEALARGQRLRGVVREGAHDVSGVADAGVLFVQVGCVLRALGARDRLTLFRNAEAFRFLRPREPSRSEGESENGYSPLHCRSITRSGWSIVSRTDWADAS